MTSNFYILKSKLKRSRISCRIEGQRIIIGKSKFDSGIVFGLILLPIVGVLLLIYLLTMDSGFQLPYYKIIIGIFVLASTSFFYLKRVHSKSKSNRDIKILYQNTLRIKETKFHRDNIDDIYFIVEEVAENEFQAKLHIHDTSGNDHLILEFYDEDERYVQNDVNWFLNFFSDYLDIQE
jgi:hypothetical protein